MRASNKNKVVNLLVNNPQHIIKEVVDRSGTDINRCLHCQSCGGGCPVSDAMTYRSNGIIRLFQLGFTQEALESSDIWYCIGCNTCSMACPQAIDIASMMDTARCCGTFLSVAKPAVVTPMVNRIMQGATGVKADCIVTACAMCQLNLEIRCTLQDQIPTFHFSEILSMALGLGLKKSWLSSHLVDPRPLLKAKGFI